jgi:hypothetical protein
MLLLVRMFEYESNGVADARSNHDQVDKIT